MVAVAILAVSLLAIFNLQSTSLMGSARARRIAVSTELAREKMSKILLDIEKGIVKGEFPEDKEESGSFEEENQPDYTWKLSVKKVDIPVPPLPEGKSEVMGQVFSMVAQEISKSAREVKLTVSWKEVDESEEEGVTVTTHVVKMQ